MSIKGRRYINKKSYRTLFSSVDRALFITVEENRVSDEKFLSTKIEFSLLLISPILT